MGQPISSIYDKPINNVYDGALAGGVLVSTILCEHQSSNICLVCFQACFATQRIRRSPVLIPLAVVFMLLIQMYGQSFPVCSEVGLFLSLYVCLTEGVVFRKLG